MIYHLLTEAEPFSEHFGGALSRWTANVLREDDSAVIVCPWADTSWNFASGHIITLPGFGDYMQWARIFRSRFAIRVRLGFLRSVLAPLVTRLEDDDVVYVHNRPEFALALQDSCRRRGARLVLHMQNSHLTYLPKKYRTRLNVDALVFCSEFLKEEALDAGVPAARTAIIPNGADEHLFFPPRNTRIAEHTALPPVVLFVGRLVPEKGAHLFVEAMRVLQDKCVSASGKIVGGVNFGSTEDSPYLERLKRERPSNVEFGEYVSGSALAEEFRNANVFCCPSTWDEPFGMVNVEAMATGLPVVATAVGGIPEIFQEGGGLLVPRDSVGELASAIELLVNDKRKRSQLSEEGYRSFQKHFRWQSIRGKYRGLIDGLLEEAA